MDESGGPPQRAVVVTIFRHLSFVIFPSIFRAPNDSERLSTYPAPAGLISARGRKDRQLRNSPLNEESRSNSGHNNKCQEPLMRRLAVRDANASSNPPKVIADADPNFSVTPKTRR